MRDKQILGGASIPARLKRLTAERQDEAQGLTPALAGARQEGLGFILSQLENTREEESFLEIIRSRKNLGGMRLC